ncbi:hypothetical protein EJ02DRAFT_419321 [Clathrospora elynae]|uniref:F-box domain-containing protein n=1 Tax=Clathrospora elynae TaxID=706981 RepID=A0A6A5SZC7_9PLEO|nr:hypothetical protein EJ02DRAFT_419321 [Clathrospora elynae]
MPAFDDFDIQCIPIAQSVSPTLPTELWLQILERADVHDAVHLWTTVRHVSRNFRDYVERLFTSIYLPNATISLALPRRDPTTGALKWPGTPIPGAQIIFLFDTFAPDQHHVLFRSPEVLGAGSEARSVEELRHTNVLPKERLQEALPWVNNGKNPLTGLSMSVSGKLDWDNESKTWTWEIDWRKLMTHFSQAKNEARLKRDAVPTVGKRLVRSHVQR